MEQQVKPLAAKPDNLNLIPGTTWWRERINSSKLSSDLCTGAVTHTHTHAWAHTHTINV